jgi:hypothetical protein
MLQAYHLPHQRGFPTAGAAQNNKYFTCPDLKRYALEYRARAENLAYVFRNN